MVDSRLRESPGTYARSSIFTILVVWPGWSRSTSILPNPSTGRMLPSAISTVVPATPSYKHKFRRGCTTCGMWRRNLIAIPPSHRHELLPPLPPPLSPQKPPAQSVLPALRLFQLRALHSLASSAQGSCTDHSACAQGALHSRRCSTYRCHRPFLVVGSSGFFTLFRAPAVSSGATFHSAIEAVAIEFVVGSPVLPLPVPRFAATAPFDVDNAFEFCCYLRSLLY